MEEVGRGCALRLYSLSVDPLLISHVFTLLVKNLFGLGRRQNISIKLLQKLSASPFN